MTCYLSVAEVQVIGLDIIGYQLFLEVFDLFYTLNCLIWSILMCWYLMKDTVNLLTVYNEAKYKFLHLHF